MPIRDHQWYQTGISDVHRGGFARPPWVKAVIWPLAEVRIPDSRERMGRERCSGSANPTAQKLPCQVDIGTGFPKPERADDRQVTEVSGRKKLLVKPSPSVIPSWLSKS